MPGRFSRVDLGASPIIAVSEVIVDGAVVPASSYRVDDYHWLVRIDGESWPCCQNLSADPATDDNTLQVSSTWGSTVPTLGVLAARRLACESYASCAGLEACALPRRLQTITRQGLTVALLDPFEFLDRARSGSTRSTCSCAR